MNLTTKKRLVAGGIMILFATIIFVYFHDKPLPVRDYSEIQDQGVLNIVTEYNSIGYYVSGDSIAGLQYKLCRYIEQRSGLKVHLSLENNLETSIQKLQQNVYDVIAMNIPVTTEIKKEVAFTVPITQNKQVLVQRLLNANDTTPLIRNQMDLAGKTLYVPKNSPNLLRLHNLSEEIAAPIYIKETTEYAQEQLLYMVAYQEIDYAVVDKEIAQKNIQSFPNIDIQTDISFTQLQAWAVRKDSPVLLDSLNVWLSGRSTVIGL
ncbi:MAG: transporter substrate-binding domain-containing protein [Candidatus Symbiothrix sp.]|jgi:membrane-bound lytic murein transglycosylase MltF|nr:transporter substrate-binding domain-containing protein [Candidatus Symbiothrix sp.]